MQNQTNSLVPKWKTQVVSKSKGKKMTKVKQEFVVSQKEGARSHKMKNQQIEIGRAHV